MIDKYADIVFYSKSREEKQKIIDLYNIDLNFTFDIKFKNIFSEKENLNVSTLLSNYLMSNTHYEDIKFFLKNGINPNIPSFRDKFIIYPLHEIIIHNIRMLEESGIIDIDPEDIRSCNLEKYLTNEGVRLLVEYGAKTNVKDGLGRTPLDVAIEIDHKPAIDYLLSVGAKKGSELSDEETYIYKTELGKMQYHIVFWHEEYPLLDTNLPDF